MRPEADIRDEHPGTQCTCFTSAKVQLLTQKSPPSDDMLADEMHDMDLPDFGTIN